MFLPMGLAYLLSNSWGLFLMAVGAYLLHLVLSMYVTSFRTFCALLVLLIILLFLSGIGLEEWNEHLIENFPVPD